MAGAASDRSTMRKREEHGEEVERHAERPDEEQRAGEYGSDGAGIAAQTAVGAEQVEVAEAAHGGGDEALAGDGEGGDEDDAGPGNGARWRGRASAAGSGVHQVEIGVGMGAR